MFLALGATAFAFGLYFAGCEVFGTYEYLLKDQDSFTYVVAAGCGIALALPMLPTWAAFAWRGRWLLSVAIWVLFVVALGAVVASALSRTGTSTDVAQEARIAIATEQTVAEKEEVDAQQAVELARNEVAKAQANIADQAALKTCASNCANLLATALSSAQERLEKAEARLGDARKSVADVPPEKSDSLARRVAAILPISEDKVRLYQPIVVPVLTSALAAVLMSLGVWSLGHWSDNRRKAKGSGKGEETASDEARTPLAAQDSGAAREPLAAPVPLVAEHSKPDGASQFSPTAAIPFMGPGARVARFVELKFARDEGAEIHMREAVRAYERYCENNHDIEHLDMSSFVRELAAFCRSSGINVRLDGKDAFLVGAKLVA